jgi:hypothetical protein
MKCLLVDGNIIEWPSERISILESVLKFPFKTSTRWLLTSVFIKDHWELGNWKLRRDKLSPDQPKIEFDFDLLQTLLNVSCSSIQFL